MLKRMLALFPILLMSSEFGICLSTIGDSTYPFVGLVKPAVVLAAGELNSKPNPDPLFAEQLRKQNGSYVISVESVRHKLKEKQDILLVDVRNKEEFEAFSIPGSVNIPLFAIKTKSFLKPKFLVLLNEGYNYDELEQACEDLRESGFTVWVLHGGLYYWKEKGGRLKGNPFMQKELNKMPPSVFFVYCTACFLHRRCPSSSPLCTNILLMYRTACRHRLSSFASIVVPSPFLYLPTLPPLPPPHIASRMD